MRAIIRGVIVATAAALLASCATAPPPPRQVVVAKPTPAPLPYRWTQGNAPKAYEDAVALFGPLALKPGDFRWVENAQQTGETKVVIDLLTQLFYVYRDDKLVGAASVSTARTGRITPLGFWSVLEKRPMYRSKKYDNAPMPWMQRIDEYGIAFHGGANPGYPASHGCIRMPMKFAEKLYGLTRVGSKVVIEG